MPPIKYWLPGCHADPSASDLGYVHRSGVLCPGSCLLGVSVSPEATGSARYQQLQPPYGPITWQHLFYIWRCHIVSCYSLWMDTLYKRLRNPRMASMARAAPFPQCPILMPAACQHMQRPPHHHPAEHLFPISLRDLPSRRTPLS